MKQKHIDLAHDLRARGDSYKSIAEEFNERGWRGARGGQWHATSIKSLILAHPEPVATEEPEEALPARLPDRYAPTTDERGRWYTPDPDEVDERQALIDAEREAYRRLSPEERVDAVAFHDPGQHRLFGQTVFGTGVAPAIKEALKPRRDNLENLMDLLRKHVDPVVQAQAKRELRAAVREMFSEVEVMHQENASLRQQNEALQRELAVTNDHGAV